MIFINVLNFLSGHANKLFYSRACISKKYIIKVLNSKKRNFMSLKLNVIVFSVWLFSGLIR